MCGLCRTVEKLLGINEDNFDESELRGDKFRPSFDLGVDKFLQHGSTVQPPTNQNQPQVIIVKEQALETNKILQYTPKVIKKELLFEPICLEDYIGQEEAKEQIRTALAIIKKLRPIHILINGWAGCGKTTLARIAASMLKADFIYRVPEQLDDVDKLLDVINLIQSSPNLTVFMLDEIHTISQFPRVANVLLPILQEWKYGDADIKPFVMIGATTDKDQLVRKHSPLVSRFQVNITLEKYKPLELQTIIKNYKEAIYKDMEIAKHDYEVISKNSRGVPREAIALLLKQLVVKDMNKVLHQSGIVKDGITKIDLKILKALVENNKPMGANYLSQACGIPQSDYEQIYERFLVEQGYISRQSRGRMISDKGKQILSEIKTKNA